VKSDKITKLSARRRVQSFLKEILKKIKKAIDKRNTVCYNGKASPKNG
jgi:hypothetical protein